MSWICSTGDSSLIETGIEMRNKKIDSLKGILILLVIIRHALQFSVKDEGGIFTNIIWALQMPGFFCVSGYLAYHEKNLKGIGRKESWKRIQRYLIPFLSWFFFVDVLLTGNNRNLPQRFTYLIYHMDTGLWFLWVLFVLSFLGLLLETIRKKGHAPLSECMIMGSSAIVFLTILLLVSRAGGSLSFLAIKHILYYSLFYLMGYMYHSVASRCHPLSETLSGIISAISLAVFLGIVFNYDLYRGEDTFLSVSLRFIAGTCGTIALLNVVSYYDHRLYQRRVNRIGQFSLELYVTHIHICHLFNHNKAETLFSYEGFLTFFISIALTMLLTVLIIRIIRAFPIFDYLFFGNIKGKDRYCKQSSIDQQDAIE